MSDGTGSIHRRGHTWWIYYGHRGRRYRESSGSRRRSDAVALLRKRMEEIGRGRLVGRLGGFPTHRGGRPRGALWRPRGLQGILAL